MKKLFLFFTTLLVLFNISHAQTFSKMFLGEDFMQYKGTLFKMDEKSLSGFNYSFYGDLKHCQKLYDNNVIYPDSKYKFNTVKDSLMNRVFRVDDIVTKDGSAYTSGSYYDKPILVLRDTSSNQVVYYLYDTQYEHNFPFLSSPIEFDVNLLCSKISKKTDEFTDEVNIHTPIIDGGMISPMILYKSIKNGRVIYTLRLLVNGSTLNVGEKGVIILFTDGSKMNKPLVEIDVDYGDNGFRYSAYITLSESEVKLLTTKKIKKFRLYIYDKEVSETFSEKFTHYVKCVIEKK